MCQEFQLHNGRLPINWRCYSTLQNANSHNVSVPPNRAAVGPMAEWPVAGGTVL